MFQTPHLSKSARTGSRGARALIALGALALSASLLSGCGSAPKAADYAAESPKLSLRSYFNGPVTAHGMFTDRDGRVVKRFKVALVGRWDGNQGVLEEDFTYSDGTTQRRVWKLTDQGGGRYLGRADDVIGEAIGEEAGNAVNFKYVLAVPVDGRIIHFDFDDWLYLMDGKVMLNKAVMSKFGVRLGEVTLTFTKD